MKLRLLIVDIFHPRILEYSFQRSQALRKIICKNRPQNQRKSQTMNIVAFIQLSGNEGRSK